MPGGRKRGRSSIPSGECIPENEDSEVSTQVSVKGKKKYKKTPAPRTQDGKIILSSEDNMWFGHPDVSQEVATTIRTNFTVFCPTWKKTPEEVRVKWWNVFKDKVVYHSDPEADVKKAFFDTAGDRLRDILHYVNTDDEKPDWMPATSFTELKAYRNSDAFKKMSQSGKANRAKHAVDGKIPGTHNMGSISSIELAERMIRDDKEGKIPTAFDLFIQVHSHNGVLADKKSEEIKKKFESRKEELLEKGEDFDEDELFVEVAGGFHKGRLYGIGSAADIYIKRPSTYSTPGSTATSYIGTGILSRVQAENAKLKEENQKLKEETQARFNKTDETIVKMQETLHTISATCSQFTHFFRRDPNEDGDSGAETSFGRV
ncbi:uncharacterized protein LOC141632695 [Silene latifolia]|uniref:uncharacterized protein LOC141632695 n=1 Tax=Silene latifolia TaxID=37657 RepID=UPI003D76E58C